MRSLIVKAGCVLLVFMPLTCPAEEQVSFVPASDSDGSRSLQKLIHFPDVQGNINVLINCDVHLSRKGIMERNFCFRRPDDESAAPFTKAVGWAVRGARLKPARVNGKRVSVYFQYSVLFERREGHERITVYPNQLRDKERLGVTYSGPQRYTISRWSEGCHFGARAWISMRIDEHGMPDHAEIVTGELTDRCRATLLEYSKSGRFIPAMLDGVPVPTTSVELFWTVDETGRPRVRGNEKASR